MVLSTAPGVGVETGLTGITRFHTCYLYQFNPNSQFSRFQKFALGGDRTIEF